MIEIQYNEKPCVFDFNFNWKEYIPDRYFESENEDNFELNYYLDLLKKYKMLKDSGTLFIWSTHYKCNCLGMPFVMVFDHDYGFVTFAVHHAKDRIKVAETLMSLIEKEKPKCK